MPLSILQGPCLLLKQKSPKLDLSLVWEDRNTCSQIQIRPQIALRTTRKISMLVVLRKLQTLHSILFASCRWQMKTTNYVAAVGMRS